MVQGSMCCGMTNTAFMVRVGPEQYVQALAQPHARAMDFTGRVLTGMVYVDPAGYHTDAALAQWITRGVDFVSRLPVKRAAPKKQQRSPHPSPGDAT